MKFLVVLALCAVAASASPVKLFPWIGQNPISVGPAIIDGENQPISVGPAIIDGDHVSENVPISVGPAIIDGDYEPIHVGPAIIDGEHDNEYEPINVGPAIIDGGVVAGPSSSPLVQIIVNVNPNSGVAGSPVIVDSLPEAGPAIIDEPKPSPIIVVDQPEPEPENVIVVEPEVAPPVISLPGILN